MNNDQYLLRPADLPTWGQRISLRMLHLLGWKMRYKPLPGPRGVVIVYPHTSNWDVVIGLLAKWTVGLPFKWLAKDNLFRGLAGKTIGPLVRWLGAVPTVRHSATGAIGRLVETMHAAPWFWLALAPEGTRGYKPYWRSGFYHIALAAKVPLLVVYLDYKHKEFGVVDYLELTGDVERDMAAIADVFVGREGLHPELAAPIRLAPPAVPARE